MNSPSRQQQWMRDESPHYYGMRQVVFRETFWPAFMDWAHDCGLTLFAIPAGENDMPTYGIGEERTREH